MRSSRRRCPIWQMADYGCPNCNGKVTRSAKKSTVARQFGLVGALVSMATAGFECENCGPIDKSEFPTHVRSQMGTNSVLMVLGAIVLFIAVIAALILLN